MKVSSFLGMILCSYLGLISVAQAGQSWTCHETSKDKNVYISQLTVTFSPNGKSVSSLKAELGKKSGVDKIEINGKNQISISTGVAGTHSFSFTDESGNAHDWQDFDVVLFPSAPFSNSRSPELGMSKAVVSIADTQDCVGTANYIEVLECEVQKN